MIVEGARRVVEAVFAQRRSRVWAKVTVGHCALAALGAARSWPIGMVGVVINGLIIRGVRKHL